MVEGQQRRKAPVQFVEGRLDPGVRLLVQRAFVAARDAGVAHQHRAPVEHLHAAHRPVVRGPPRRPYGPGELRRGTATRPVRPKDVSTGSRPPPPPGRVVPPNPHPPQETPMTGTAAPFAADDYRARMKRAARSAAEAGLAGLLVAPGPDLVWLTGYAPTAVTERLTLLVLVPGQDPVLVVPTLEAPDAAKAT